MQAPANVSDLAVTGLTRGAGAGELAFTRVDGRTVLTRAFAASPLKILSPRRSGASAWAYLATYGGGLVGGDRIDLRVNVGRDAAALVSTQASTKVYRSPLGASQRLDAEVGNGALLVLLPDPVTCFAGATYVQDQRIQLNEGGSVAIVDRLTAGRIAHGERWMFDRCIGRTVLRRSGRLLLHDCTELSRDDGEISRRLGRFDVLTNVVLAGPALAATAARLRGMVESTPAVRRGDVLIAAARVGDDGVLLRMACRSSEQAASRLRDYLGVLPFLLGDDPWLGK